MGRKYVDCRELSGDAHCSTTIAAENDKELMQAALKHAINVHGLANTAELRKQISSHFKEGNPPL
ncbi:DUF1059 domain-containing protein [Geopsychrobacter electrodiphilus]|uniref:DUF1059 domain-containing protein n=1 Tax=Geopsychrobacter electrodiphilus TaxID=225196 RepID=UPI0003664153|nr:DUF1059 domain-containing protein [Geopsychrobacter electrodiphilus]